MKHTYVYTYFVQYLRNKSIAFFSVIIVTKLSYHDIIES